MTEDIVAWIETLLEGKFGLTINRKKTKIVDLERSKQELLFLGFSMRLVDLRKQVGRKFCLTTPSAKSVKKAKEKIREHTHARNGYKSVQEVVSQLNLFLHGWEKYFRKGNPSAVFDKINGYTDERV